MSRKAHADRSTWKTLQLYAFQGGYGPWKPPRDEHPIQEVLVLLTHTKEEGGDVGSRHPMWELAGDAQEIWVRQDFVASPSDVGSSHSFKALLVLDIRSMFQTSSELNDAIKREAAESELTKKFGKAILKSLERLRLRNVGLAATGEGCQVLLKLAKFLGHSGQAVCTSLWLLYPVLPAAFINKHFVGWRGTLAKNTPLNVLFESETAQNRRLDMLRHAFPDGWSKVWNADRRKKKSVWRKGLLAAALLDCNAMDKGDYPSNHYEPDYCNDMGKSLFVSSVTVDMSPYTKQYERHGEDITSDFCRMASDPGGPSSAEEVDLSDFSCVDWSICEHQVGGLVLRGNRCVLVRSLAGEWSGMKLPSVIQKVNESPHDAAVRSITHLCGVDATEVKIVPQIPPVAVYTTSFSLSKSKSQRRPLMITLYPLYATQPPPDGPLEEADLEDDETPYDWYTLENAAKKLDERSIAALRVLSMALLEAANVGILPCKWGGVFGQEMVLSINHDAAVTGSHQARVGQTQLTVTPEEWQPSRQADILQDVRKAKTRAGGDSGSPGPSILLKQSNGTSARETKLPVTVLSGFLGSGKTTLMTHILTNCVGLKVAILVNDMGEVNIDAALLRQATTTVSIHQSEEHLVSLSNGCICCTLREDLLTEVAKIAAHGTFDYLLIESSGISEPLPVAETFTFEDNTGLKLGDIASIDTLVTVVDGSRFVSELTSLETLRQRDWHSDPEDQRTIAHLLCDQVEFANVVILNKCDLMNQKQKNQVQQVVHKMNPTAKLIEATYSAVPMDSVLGTGLFSLTEAERHDNWLKEARLGEHTPETEEYGISSFTYRALKPFHSKRLHDTLEAVLSQEPPFQSILRAKGFMWLACCQELQAEFSLAGQHYSLLPGNPWWAAIDRSDWPSGLDRDIVPLWHEPYGDRQQEIVIIGQHVDKELMSGTLDQCLLTESEYDGGPDAWNLLCPDSNPLEDSWNAACDSLVQQHDHDHEHHPGSHGEHSLVAVDTVTNAR